MSFLVTEVPVGVFGTFVNRIALRADVGCRDV